MRVSKRDKKTLHKDNQVAYPTRTCRKINMMIKKAVQISEWLLIQRNSYNEIEL